jgi:predicted nucleic acid-binding protein
VRRAFFSACRLRLRNLDMMFGAQALASDPVLVTNDQAFRRIKKLKVEDWDEAVNRGKWGFSGHA